MPVTNKKYSVGVSVNGWTILQELGSQRVIARCPKCGKEVEHGRAHALNKTNQCIDCKNKGGMIAPGSQSGGWTVILNLGGNKCQAKCNRCGRVYGRQIAALKKSPGCRSCFPPNMKHPIGHVIGSLRLLERIGNRVKVECVRCRVVRLVSLQAYVQSKDACQQCSVAHNKKYHSGDTVNHWLLLEQVAPEVMRVQCTGPICGGRVFLRRPSSLIESQGCRQCFGSVRPHTQQAKDRQLSKIMENNQKLHEEFCLKHIGQTYAWLKVVDVDGKCFICKCLGEGPHLQPKTFDVLSNDVLMGKTTSCGCMRKQKYLDTMLRIHGVKSMVDIPGHREKMWAGIEASKREGSQAELEILAFVRDELGIHDAQKLLLPHEGRVHEIDIYSASARVGIEYNGLYWHSEGRIELRLEPTDDETIEEFENRKTRFAREYHLNKSEICAANQIRLIHVFEHEWRDRPHQIKSFLRSVFKKNIHSVGARECEIREISWGTAKAFLEEHHIQGSPVNSTWRFGCFHGNELLYVAVFAWHHRGGAAGKVAELSRLCGKKNWNVHGAMSKILDFAVSHLKNSGVERLVTWADRRFSLGEGYLKSGWEQEAILPPGYFYFDAALKMVIGKQSRQKSIVGTPVGMTEAEHAMMDGLSRVWDCGKIRFVYPLA